MENLEAVSLWKPFAFRQILENVAFIVLMGYFAIEISRVIVQPSSILVPHSGKIVDGITSRVGFTIPANDLTKRGRSPKTFRIESSTPPSSSLSLSARQRSYSPIYIRRCNLRWAAVPAAVYLVNNSKSPSVVAAFLGRHRRNRGEEGGSLRRKIDGSLHTNA